MMQSGQPKKPDPAYEERLAEMQRKYGVILERIQAYDAILVKQDGLQNLLEKLEEKVKADATEFLKYKENNEKSFWGTEQKFKLHQGVQEKLSQSIDQLSTNAKLDRDMALKQASEISSAFDKMVDHVKTLDDLMIDKTQMEQLMKHIFEQIDKVSFEKQPLKAEIEKLKLENFKLADSLKQVQAFPEKYIELLGSLSQALDDFKSEVDGRFAGTDMKYDSSLKIFMQNLQKKMDVMKEEILGTPSSNAKVKEELEKKLEMVALDGSNAVIKANNVDSRIQLLEKKLENLQLLVKRNELKG